MNYSENQTYGRKIVKGAIKNKNFLYRRLFISLGISFLIGLIIGNLLFWGISSIFKTETTPVETYGTLDGKVFADEPSFGWSSVVELSFVPLDVPMDEEMQEFIYWLSYGYNIDFPLVMAVIEGESSFRADTISKTNDYGLMQINKVNHSWLTEKLGVTDFLDPYENTRSGMFILRKLFEKYEEPSKVLMAYNMGETGASRLWKKGIYETDYSKKIMEQAVEYKKEISERKVNSDD